MLPIPTNAEFNWDGHSAERDGEQRSNLRQHRRFGTLRVLKQNRIVDLGQEFQPRELCAPEAIESQIQYIRYG